MRRLPLRSCLLAFPGLGRIEPDLAAADPRLQQLVDTGLPTRSRGAQSIDDFAIEPQFHRNLRTFDVGTADLGILSENRQVTSGQNFFDRLCLGEICSRPFRFSS
jgi:hypothetical protein